ncbi:unnamed protein product [Prunus armeniaca]
MSLFCFSNEWVQVKKLVNVYDCGIVDHNFHANSTWLAQGYATQLSRLYNWDMGTFKHQVQEDLSVIASKSQIYRVRLKATSITERTYEKQYELLWDYVAELRRTNVGSTVIIKCELEGKRPRFQRIYIFLAAIKQGFLQRCRPMIRFDACHIKGHHPGQLLYVVGVDPNNGLVLKLQIEKIARSTTIPWCDVEMKNMRQLSQATFDWVAALDPSQCPRICGILEKTKKESAWCIPKLAGESLYEVKNHDRNQKEAFMRAYSPMVHPMTSEDLWPKCYRPPLMPPLYHKKHGRPRKKRMRSVGEQPCKSNPTATKLQRYNLEIKCSICKQGGYNRRSYPKAKEGTSSKVLSKPKVKKTIDTTSTQKVTRQSRAKQLVRRRLETGQCSQTAQSSQTPHASETAKAFETAKKKKRFKSPSKRIKFTKRKDGSQTVQGSQSMQGSESVQDWPVPLVQKREVQISYQEEEIYLSEGFVRWLSALEILMMCKCSMFC